MHKLLIYGFIMLSLLGLWMKKIVRNVLITIGWAIVVSTIALRTLYDRFLAFLLYERVEEYAAVLRPLDFVLIFLVSVLAGVLLHEPGSIVFSYLGSLALSGLIVYVGLTMPIYAGKTHGLGRLLQESAINFMFTNLLFGPLFLLLVGSFLGGILGERLLT